MSIKFNYRDLLKDENNYYILYISLLYLLTTYYLFQLPIYAGDTDLWYHLNSGRYIFTNKSIPKDSFFSFISPPREWVDYFWLFQVLVYKIHSLFGYYGLVFLRAFTFLTISILILCFFFKNSPKNNTYFYFTIIFSLYSLLLIPRYNLVRPHIFTYLFIVLFLYILEFKRKKAVYLPVLAILWTNLHGIIYPIMLLIVLAYLVEFFLNHIKDKTHIQKSELFYIIPLILSIAAVYLTPHGSNLMWIPLIPTGFASLYINELGYIAINDLLSFQIKDMVLSYPTVFNLLFFMSCLALIVSFLRKGRRISHILLFAGGAVLLAKGNRFRFEFVLLTLPILKNFLLAIPSSVLSVKNIKPAKILIVILLLLIPLITLKGVFNNLPKFPFSSKNLPHGIATFLQKVNTGGNVLNHPNKGGYLQWMLYPKYKIFMDMEVPFLFTNEDFYTVQNVYSNKVFFERVIKQYNPSFITVPREIAGFEGLIKDFPEYKIVFFDDYEILYVNEKHYPSLVKEYVLKVINPYTLTYSSVSSFKDSRDIEPVLKELLKILEIYQEGIIANQCVAIIYNREGKYEKALLHGETIVKNYPEFHVGYQIRGDSFKGLNMLDKAIKNYKMALKRQDNPEINKQIGFVYFKQHKYREAYNTLVRVMNFYAPGTTYQDLYYLIVSALESGRIREAEILFRYAYQSVPTGDKEWYKKYQELQTKIQEPE